MPRFDASLPRVLTPAEAVALGITRAQCRTQIRRGNWRALASGVLLTRPDEPTRADWAETGVAIAGSDAAVTGWDALRPRGLGGRVPPPGPPLVLMRDGLSRRVRGVRLRRTSRPYAATVLPPDADRLALTPIVGVARAVADAAFQFHDRDTVRALVTAAVQRRACHVEDLLAELRHCPRNGSGPLRAALVDAADGARSVAEARAARLLAEAPVPAFELNVPVLHAGRVVYVVDVLWRGLRAALEIDSREYHLSEAEWKATMTRHNDLLRLGLAVAHYPPSAVGRAGWTDEVAAWLHARAAELGVPYPARRGVIRPRSVADPAPFVVR